jgi:hypothetical protein
VKIGTDEKWRWLTLPVESHTGYSIMEVKLKTNLMKDRWSLLERFYKEYPLWEEYKSDLKSIFLSYEKLWELNLRFILWIRDLLRIRTYISISWQGIGHTTTERISYQFANYGPVLYLAGKMSPHYLDIKKYEDLTNSKVALVTYIPPPPFSQVTTLTPLLMYHPSEVLQVLKVSEGPIKVIVNGHEGNVHKSALYKGKQWFPL